MSTKQQACRYIASKTTGATVITKLRHFPVTKS